VAGNPAPEPAVAPPPVPRIAPPPSRGSGTGVVAAIAGAMVVGVLVGTRLHHARRGSS
jgi:hypothetical protein